MLGPSSWGAGMAPSRVGEARGQKWWRHHIMNTRAYLEAALAGDQNAAVAALGALWKAILDWQRITGSPVAGVLMAEHTALAKLLVDGFASDAGEAWTSTAADAIGKNVESHRLLFPQRKEEFARLFGEHSGLAGQYITDLANGRTEDFERHFAQALANGDVLAEFTDRTFAG